MYEQRLGGITMNGAKVEERNIYAESYSALLDATIKEIQNIVKEIQKAMCEV